jgi:putative oxidoreductase
MSTTTLDSTRITFPAGIVRALLRTEDGVAPLIARLALGLVMLPHGLQKVFGWFGGYGFEGTMGFLTGQVGLPWVVAFLVILIESLGAVALIVGALGRLAALGMVALMAGAVATTHLANGFFMNWTGQQAGEGFEYHLLVIALAAVVMVAGSGKASLDRLLSR